MKNKKNTRTCNFKNINLVLNHVKSKSIKTNQSKSSLAFVQTPKLISKKRKLVPQKSNNEINKSELIETIKKKEIIEVDQKYELIFHELYQKDAHSCDITMELTSMAIFIRSQYHLKKRFGFTLEDKGKVFCLHGESGTGKTTIINHFKSDMENYFKTIFNIKIIHYLDFYDWYKENGYSLVKEEQKVFLKYIKQMFLTNNMFNEDKQTKLFVFEDIDCWFVNSKNYLKDLKLQTLEKMIGVGNCLIFTFSNFNSSFLFNLNTETLSKKLKDIELLKNTFTINQLKPFLKIQNNSIHLTNEMMTKIFSETKNKWKGTKGLDFQYQDIHNQKIKINEKIIHEWIYNVSSRIERKTTLPNNKLKSIFQDNWATCKPNLQKFKSTLMEILYNLPNQQLKNDSFLKSIDSSKNKTPTNYCNSMIEKMSVCFNTNGTINKKINSNDHSRLTNRFQSFLDNFTVEKPITNLLDNTFRYYPHHKKITENSNQLHNSPVPNYLENISQFDVYNKKMWINKEEDWHIQSSNHLFMKIQNQFNNDLSNMDNNSKHDNIDFDKSKDISHFKFDDNKLKSFQSTKKHKITMKKNNGLLKSQFLPQTSQTNNSFNSFCSFFDFFNSCFQSSI